MYAWLIDSEKNKISQNNRNKYRALFLIFVSTSNLDLKTKMYSEKQDWNNDLYDLPIILCYLSKTIDNFA
jgi:hypothetical protein